MSTSFLRHIGISALLVATMLPGAGALSDPSDWAAEEVAAAETAGIAPPVIAEADAQGQITRAEFCGIAVNTYKALSGKAVFVSAKKPFRDCNDPNVVAAYELGLLDGGGNGYFYPDHPIERQEICQILYRILEKSNVETFPETVKEEKLLAFPDTASVDTAAWQAMCIMTDYDIISGVADEAGTLQLAPAGAATRQEALLMAHRFCTAFTEVDLPLDYDSGWDMAYDTYLASVTSSASDPSALSDGYTALWADEDAKMDFVYGPGGSQYQSEAEAEANMVGITVPVWRLQPDGSKTPDTASLQVNASLAPIYSAIFEEIFNGSERFPIKDVGCYNWRPGEHAQGTAIDINYEENMEATINADGSLTPTCGTHWSPYSDPYSIPEGGDVYNAFTKYGFKWGGNAWKTKRDYMHFSFFGR